MLQTLINAFKVKDIRAKVWKMLLLLLIFRIGCYIPIPGLDSSVFSENVTGNDFLTLMNSSVSVLTSTRQLLCSFCA